jgi:hypothetical protein
MVSDSKKMHPPRGLIGFSPYEWSHKFCGRAEKIKNPARRMRSFKRARERRNPVLIKSPDILTHLPQNQCLEKKSASSKIDAL